MAPKRITKSYAVGESKLTDGVDANSVAQNFFGAAYVAEARDEAEEGEKILSVNMRLMTKASHTTKQKALGEMMKAIPTASDEVVAGFLYNFLDVIEKHLFHENPQLRCAIFKTLCAFVNEAGKETKRQVVQNLGTFMSMVLFGAHDPDPQVAKAANNALTTCFAEPEKRAVALARSFSDVSAFVTASLEKAFSVVNVIKNDDEETEAFAIIMAFGTVGYLLANHPTPSEVQPFALTLLKGQPNPGFLRRCLPTDPARPAKMIAAAPKVRVAAFSVLTSLIAVTAPIAQRDYALVWTCCMQGITDTQPSVVFIAWQLALKWIERYRKEAVDSMPDPFIGIALTQIDNLSVHNSGSAFEALLQALLPLIAVISREERHAGVVDDVCGTLVEKIKVFSARPNSREYELLWATLWECWDLHLLRKSARNEAEHSLELLAVMLAVLVEQGADPNSKGRLWDALETTVAPLAAKYLLKAVQRTETITNASEALMTLLDDAQQFKVISHPKDMIVLLRFATFVGCLWLGKQGTDMITKDVVKDAIAKQWMPSLFNKLLCVCERTETADGEDEDDAAANKRVAYDAISRLVKALATTAEKGGQAAVVYSIDDDVQNRIVAATGGWDQFPSRLAPYLFKAEKMRSMANTTSGNSATTTAASAADTNAVTLDDLSPSTNANGSPSPATGAAALTTSKTARTLLDRIYGVALIDDAAASDIKVLTVAIDNDNVSPDEMLSLLHKCASSRRFIDVVAAIFKALARVYPDDDEDVNGGGGVGGGNKNNTGGTTSNGAADTTIASSAAAGATNNTSNLLKANAVQICDTVREAIVTLWEAETNAAAIRSGKRKDGGKHRGTSSLAYDNEAPSSGSDSSSDDSSSSDDDSSDDSSSDGSSDDSSSDDDSSSNTSSSDDDDKDDDVNIAEEVKLGLVEWMDIIGDDSFAKCVLPTAVEGDANSIAARRALTAPIAKAIFLAIANISPLLHVEQFVSLRFLRAAMTKVEAALESETFLHSVFRKRSHLKSADYDALLAVFIDTCEDALGLEEDVIVAMLKDFFEQYIYNLTVNWNDQLSATSHLEDVLHLVSSPMAMVPTQQLIKLATPFLKPRRYDHTADVVGLNQIEHTIPSLAGMLRLGQLAAAVAKDTSARKELLATTPLDSTRIAGLVVALVAVLNLRLCVSDGVIKACKEALRDVLMALPTAGTFGSQADEAAAHQVWRTAMAGLAQHALMPCFAEEIAEVFAEHGTMSSGGYSRRSVTTAAADWYVTLGKDNQNMYADAFQSFLDRTGVVASDKDRSITLGPNTEATIRAALKAPATLFPIAVSYLMIMRGASSRATITDEEVMNLGIRCQKPSDEAQALALVAELLCANNGSPDLYTELCRMATNTATKNYQLAQLPPNGKLLQRPNTVVPTPLENIQPTIAALAKASKGMVMHRKRDDILRSTINLVVFDAVCDAVSRLRAATSAALAPAPLAPTASAAAFSAANLVNSRNTSLAAIVIFVGKAYKHIATLQAGDIASIAASERAVSVLSNTLASVHMWVCGTTVAQLEAIGVSNVLEVVSCANTLAIVALNQSPVPIQNVVHLTRKKLLPKGARILHFDGAEHSGKVTTAKVVKMPHFKKIYTDIERTTKQKLSLFTWLTSWAVTLTNKNFAVKGPAEDEVAAALEGSASAAASPKSPANPSAVDRSELVQLLDIIMALLLCPYTAQGGKGRVDNTFLYLGADQLSAEDNGFAFRPLVLGKLQYAASMHTAKRMGQEMMGVLARGAAAVLALAVQSPALPIIRDWLETIDASVRQRFLGFAEEHLCPILIQTSLVGVLAHSPTGDMTFELEEGYTVKLDMERRWISLSFTFEDVTSSMDITLPKTYPIIVSPDMVKPTFQSSGKQAIQLRTWCMKMSMALFSGESSSLWDAVEMFGKNMKGYLDGVEPCPICYCVMSTKKTIPDMACSVCHNKCHKICLNKWWSNTGNCTCPYCRSPWVV